MVGKTISILFLSLGLNSLTHGQSFCYYYFSPEKTVEISKVVEKFDLKSADKDSLVSFNKLNAKGSLIKGKSYKMPIRVYKYSGNNIRSSVGIENYSLAQNIEKYNKWAEKDGLKKSANQAVIWVPLSYLKTKKSKFEPYTTCYNLLGKSCEIVTVTDEKLKDNVYYLISGHGGPDPGANCEKGYGLICEDEYAYDIVLRLARNLISHSATVYMIIKDENDGLRDETYLKHDHDEVTHDGSKIPLNQIERLKQRTDLINKLYKEHEGKFKQQLIEIHVDSRHVDQKIDLFFYHYPGSEEGKLQAERMLSTVKEKYSKHQKERGYSGVVKPRNLYSLRETLPTGVYIEVGNITNEFDQKRILFPNNRQALANWLTEGLMN
jgi:N-acetylmuramoyl-L-alanine amidase